MLAILHYTDRLPERALHGGRFGPLETVGSRPKPVAGRLACDQNEQVSETNPVAGLRAQLNQLAIGLAFPDRGLDVDQAITVACDLLALASIAGQHRSGR